MSKKPTRILLKCVVAAKRCASTLPSLQEAAQQSFSSQCNSLCDEASPLLPYSSPPATHFHFLQSSCPELHGSNPHPNASLQLPCSAQKSFETLAPSSSLQPLHFAQKGSTETLGSNTLLGCGSPVDHDIQVLCRRGLLDVAFLRLDELSGPPSHDTLIVLLKTCAKFNSSVHAKRIHAFLNIHHVQLQGSLGEHLVSTFARCGSLHDACVLLYKLPVRTSMSWSSVMSSLVDHGRPREALSMYEHMVHDGVNASCHTFATLFKACGNIPDIEQGRKLHADARLRGFTSLLFVGNVLVSMYKKCGSIVEAEEVFGGLPRRDVVSWNSMLSAYLEQGEGEKALLLYRQMRMESFCPNQQTFVLALQACALLAEREEANILNWKNSRFKYLSIVQALHAEAKKLGFDTHVFVGTTLVTMYGKCGTILEAEQVSSIIPEQDVISWSAMLSAYGHQGQGMKALQLYRKMLEEGMNPDPKAFAIAFQACLALAQEENSCVPDISTKTISLQIARALQIDAWRKGFTSDAALGSLLVGIYSKCGTIKEAEVIFCEVPYRDLTAWTAMMSAYIDHGQEEKAMLLYRQMQEEGIKLDHQAFATALQACGALAQEEEAIKRGARSIKVRSLDIVQALHADARRACFASDSFVCNTLISVYGMCGAIAEAVNVFSGVSMPDAMMWLKLISAYLEQGQGENTLLLFRHMQETGTCPSTQTFFMAIQACGLLATNEETVVAEGRFTKKMSLQMGQALLVDAEKQAFHLDVFVATALVNLLGKCGSIEDAENVCVSLSQPDVVLWTAMLSAYIEQGQGEKALELYMQMQSDSSLTLDDVIVVCVLQACGKTGSLEIARHLHFALGFALHNLSCFLASALTYAYGSCASIGDVQAVFDRLSEPDLITWNACIAGYAGEGDLLASQQMAQEMQSMGCNPDGVTFVSLLSACSHVGLVYRGLQFIEALSRDYQLTPDLKHYSTLLDLLGRAGDFGRVESLLPKMPSQADLATWLCLLGACRIHGNVELAKRAFDIGISLQANEAAPYILMSRIYVEAGMQSLADEVDKLRPQVCRDVNWQELD